MLLIVSYIVSAFSLLGTVMNIKKLRACFIVWLFTNGFWLVYSILTEQYSRAILDFIYLLLAIYGIYEWSKKAKSNKVGEIHGERAES